MKAYIVALFSLAALQAHAQQDSTRHRQGMQPTYLRHTVTASVSLGFADANRTDYPLPAGFEKGKVSGFAPILARVEYGLTRHVSIAAMFCYDAFVHNLQQDYIGANGAFTRYKTNNTRVINGGIAAFYHAGSLLHSRNFDPFIGAGLCLNNIRYQANPQGDSTAVKIDHTVTPYLKIGARYYISNQFSLVGDVGLDKQAIISIGFSCRFFRK